MKRRNFLSGLAALIASPKTIEAFQKETIDKRNIFVDKKGIPLTQPFEVKYIPIAREYRSVDSAEDLERGDIVVVNTEFGGIRKAKYEDDVLIGVVISKDITRPNHYIIGIH
jgi:hypothetical protein